MDKAIILGNDHTNSIGLIHSLGRNGVYTIAVVWGRKTGIVIASNYVSEFYSASTPQDCMQLIIDKFGTRDERFVIIPGCDDAAAVIEEFENMIPKNFLFQFVNGKYSLCQLDNKELQVKLAEIAGFNTPKSWIIDNLDRIPTDISFPCLIKSLIAREGSKSDLIVSQNKEDFIKNLYQVLSRTRHVQVQQYIEKDYDFDVMGCRFSDGEIYIPICLKKLDIYPPKVGLATISETVQVPSEIFNAAVNFIKEVDYYGIFDFEYMHSMTDDKNYFIECNLRNSGSNAFALRSGYNIPLYHFQDFTGTLNKKLINRAPVGTNYYIREMHYLNAFRNKSVSLTQLIKDIKKSGGNLTYYKDDKKPYFAQWTLLLKHKFGKNAENY